MIYVLSHCTSRSLHLLSAMVQATSWHNGGGVINWDIIISRSSNVGHLRMCEVHRLTFHRSRHSLLRSWCNIDHYVFAHVTMSLGNNVTRSLL